MKEIDFYSGFEGEPSVVLYGNDEVIYIWNGYFTPIMDIMLEVEVNKFGSAFGMVAEWHTCTGWCEDSSKCKVENLDAEIDAFSRFDWEKFNKPQYEHINDDWKNVCRKVHEEMLKLFKKAKEQEFDVYIESD